MSTISPKEQFLKQLLFIVPLIAGLFLLSACATQSAQASAPQSASPGGSTSQSQNQVANVSSNSKVSFANDVMPILKDSCNKCHGGEKTEKGLDMISYNALMAGSDRGAVVVPGDAANSSFIRLLMNGKMPKRGQKLSDAQIQLLTDWVNAGAPNN